MRRSHLAGLLLALSAAPLGAQEGLTAACGRPEVALVGGRGRCLTVAQAVASAQPQLGLLIASGNPLIGDASSGGLRLGLIPRLSAGLKANTVFVKVPDVLEEDDPGGASQVVDEIGVPVPAISADVSLGVTGGLSLAPTVGGLGAITLLGNATWLPFNAVDFEGLGGEAPDFAYGFGARVGILRESFTMPGVSVSVMYRSLGTVAFGEVCDVAPSTVTVEDPTTGEARSVSVCTAGGDLGEFAFDLTDWSTRLTVGKGLLGLGLTGGIGYDRFASDLAYGFRSPTSVPGPGDEPVTPVFLVPDVDLDTGRWSAFADLSFTVLVATIALEGGWLQGGDALPGFDDAGSDFDPGAGTWFGSLGARLAF